jgi:hypothetical protein
MRHPSALPKKRGSVKGKRFEVKQMFGREGAAGDAPHVSNKTQARQGKHAMNNALGDGPHCTARSANGKLCEKRKGHSGSHTINGGQTMMTAHKTDRFRNG